LYSKFDQGSPFAFRDIPTFGDETVDDKKNRRPYRGASVAEIFADSGAFKRKYGCGLNRP
jgi:hypothetical protein